MKTNERKKRICLISSSGGHYEQLLMLLPLLDKYDGFIVTERTKYVSAVKDKRIYYLKQINRREVLSPIYVLLNMFLSLRIFFKERPDYVISTGVLATIPICLIAKVFRKKIIYIESFAKVSTGTQTGKLLYKFADQFYVQWEEMLKVYPNAIFKGGIY